MDEPDFHDLDAYEDEGEEEVLDPDNPAHAFIILEREYSNAVNVVERNPDIALYGETFARAFEILTNKYARESDLVEQCESLQRQVEEDEAKLGVATKLAEIDSGTIAQLRGKIEFAWKMADNAHDREQQAQETIDNLRKEVASLTAEIEMRNKMGQKEDEEGAEESQDKEGLQKEKERLMIEVGQITDKLTNALNFIDDLEERANEYEQKINDLNTDLRDQGKELTKQKEMYKELEDDLTDLAHDIQAKEEEMATMSIDMERANKAKEKMEKQLNIQKLNNERLTTEVDLLTAKHTKLQQNHTCLRHDHEEAKTELARRVNAMKLQESELTRMRIEEAKFIKIRDGYDKKLQKMELEKQNIELDRDKLRQLYVTMEKEIEDTRKSSEADKRSLELMQREKDVLTKSLLRQQAVAKDHINLIKIQEQTKKKLHMEIDEYVLNIGKQKNRITFLEKERDRLAEEGIDLSRKMEDLMDEIKMHKSDMNDLKKLLAENENKLRMQQNLFDTVRAERNALQKSLQEYTAECSELKTKLKICIHQAEQLKEDISMKEQQLVAEENILRKITKEKDNLRMEVNNCMDTIKQLRHTINQMADEEKRLHKAIMESDRTIRGQLKDLEQLMIERDIMGSQVVRRNDELALLYEKVRILQSTLHRGEAHYDQRLEDMRLLKIEIKRLRLEKHLLTRTIQNSTDLRHEVFLLERDLTRERVKIKALEEELQNPLNIHRWRKLEGSDPDVIELLKKVQLLQRRLLKQAAESIERERQLKESQMLYMNLREVLSRQPGPEVKNVLLRTQKALTIRGNKMKCLVSELNISEQQTLEYKENVEKLRGELKELKQKYLQERLRKRKLAEELQTIRKMVPINNTPANA